MPALAYPFCTPARSYHEQMKVAFSKETTVPLRKECPELGWGACRPLDVPEPAVFAHRCDWRGRTIVCAHNLAERACSFRLDGVDALVDLFGGETVGPDLELDAYGYRWFRATG